MASFLLARPTAARIKACWRCLRKQHRRNPGSIKCQYHLLCIQPSCKYSHPSGLSFLLPTSISKGEVEAQMLQCDLPHAPTFPPLFPSPPALLGRGVWCCPTQELQPKPRCSTCPQGESAAFPPKKGYWESWGSYIRLQQPRKVDVGEGRGKSSTRKARQETRMPLAADLLGNPLR